MTKRARIFQLDFSGGQNTKDHPRHLDKNQCQALVNLYPGDVPRAREGCSAWNLNQWPGDVNELIRWDFSDGNKVIAFTSSGFYWMKRGNTAATLIASLPSKLRPDSKICWQRVEGALIIGSETGWSGIIEWSATDRTFVLRSANIPLPVGAFVSLSDGSVPGKLTPSKWYSYAFTLVNVPENAGKTVTVGFIPGKLESWEDQEKRVTFKTDAASSSIYLEFGGLESVDSQVTHVRVYRTQPQDEESVAQGFSHTWIADIAYTAGVNPTFLDGIAGSEADPTPSTSGLNELPACRSMIYSNGRLWINGAFGGSPGRWWYSSGIQDAVGYLKNLTLFALKTDFKDCSLDDAEIATGAMIVQGDLYLFNQRSIFRIADADPANNPKVVSTKIGCRFPRTLTASDTWGLFLSDYGPRMIQGGAIDPVKGFLSGEVWPNSHVRSSILSAGPEEVVGFWYRSSWIIAAGRTVVGFFDDEASNIRGAFSIEFADPTMSLRRAAVFSEEECVIAGDRRCIWFLRDTAKTDMGYWITARVKARRFYIDVSDPGAKGEPWDVRIGCSFRDEGSLKTYLVGDEERFRKRFVYSSRPKTALLQPQDVSRAVVTTYQQAIPAGLHASYFDIEVEKVLRPPFDFTLTGIEMGYIPRRSRPQDDVSLDLGEDVPIDQGLSVVDAGENVSETP